MPILPSDLAKITSEETDSESPISEQTLQKIGSSINGLIDLSGLSLQTFLSSGTFNVPENITKVLLIGCGGGGGAGAGGTGGLGAFSRIAGFGAPLAVTTLSVTPLDAISVIIGSGGAGTTTNLGNPGGNTFFGSQAFVGGGPGGYFGDNIYGKLSLVCGRVGYRVANNTDRYVAGYFGGAVENNFYIGPEPSPLFTPPSGANNSDFTNNLRGGTGPFGLGGAGSSGNSPSSAAANTGAGGGTTIATAGSTGGSGGSGRLYVFY